MSAADQWGAALESWALPQTLLDDAPESPYGWPAELWRRRMRAEALDPTPTTDIVHRLAGDGGSVMDVGAGTGRGAVPLARLGHTVTAVERSESMLEGLRAETSGLDVTVVDGAWPDVVWALRTHDVVTSAHVVYDVADIGPFVDAMHRKSRRGVVVEMTPEHPWSHLSPYYRALHDLDRPTRPTVEDFVAVVNEVVGVAPEVERWERPGGLQFADLQELLALYAKRLLIGPDRMEELTQLLEPDIVSDGGWLTLGPNVRTLATVWWAAS